MENIADEHNKKRLSTIVLLELNKAFDTVWHDGLLLNLNKYSFSLHIIKIIDSYLKDRKFIVKISKEQLQNKIINAGVPQASVLDPTLFNICINDLTTNPKTNLTIFADLHIIMVIYLPKKIFAGTPQLNSNVLSGFNKIGGYDIP